MNDAERNARLASIVDAKLALNPDQIPAQELLALTKITKLLSVSKGKALYDNESPYPSIMDKAPTPPSLHSTREKIAAAVEKVVNKAYTAQEVYSADALRKQDELYEQSKRTPVLKHK